MTEKQLRKMKLILNSPMLLPFVVLILLSLTTVGITYAWTSISKTPLVSDIGLTVLTENRLEIAPDEDGEPGEWGVELDLSEMLSDLAPLTAVTYSKSQDGFRPLGYGEDGRADAFSTVLFDDRDANVKSDVADEGYYIAVKFWMRAPTTATISLSEAKEVDDGIAGTGTYVIGSPVWDSKAVQHTDGAYGLETAIRVGIRCQTTDLQGNPVKEEVFYIYEPNTNIHVDGSTGELETTSIDGGALIDDDHLIRQTASSWDETTPVLSSTVIYQMGEFEDNVGLFEVSPNTMQKITLYLWLEGQDVDCIDDAAPDMTNVLANMQFTAGDAEIDTGISRDE